MSDNKRKFYFKKGKDYGQNYKKNKKDKQSQQDIQLDKINCPLCENDNKEEIIEFSKRMNKLYFGCNKCGLVYMHPHYYVDNQKEKTRYEFHQNSPQDEKYKSFLQPCVDKLIPLLKEISNDNLNSVLGLDYGCGPGPTLSLMFKEKDITVENYDPFFLENEKVTKVDKYLLNQTNNSNNNSNNTNDNSNSNKDSNDNNNNNSNNDNSNSNNSKPDIQPYNFITCTEAIEHFKEPIKDLKKIIEGGLISKDNGLLLIMTQLLLNDEQFENWHYPRDYTHICFFRPSTFKWIANRFNINILELDEKKGIVIFKFNNINNTTSNTINNIDNQNTNN